jgi:hypothetical protein
MEWMRISISRCAAFFARKKLDEDLDEELRAHIDLAVEEKVKRGLARDDARQSALREFGPVTQVKELYRTERGFGWLDTLAQDLRFAARMLARAPASPPSPFSRWRWVSAAIRPSSPSSMACF